MATATLAMRRVWARVVMLYNGPGVQDEELAGIVHGPNDTPGFHWSYRELRSVGIGPGQYPLVTQRDIAGARAKPDNASAIDIHFGPQGMITVTKRLIASAEDPDDHRLDGWYEFCGTTNGRTPHPYTIDTNTDDPNNTQGWDQSHVTHVHASCHYDVNDDFDAIKGIADVMAGVPLHANILEEIMALDRDSAEYKALMHDISVAVWDAEIAPQSYPGVSAGEMLTLVRKTGVADLAVDRKDLANET